MKNPAFLFYANDFYTETRMMTPEERAAYIDLLIYQHKFGEIPNDLARVQLFVTGVSKQVLEQVLEQMFSKTPTGFKNLFLENTQKRTKNYVEKRKNAGKLSAFWRYASKKLSRNQYKKLKKCAEKKNLNQLILNEIEQNKQNAKQMFQHVFEHVLNKMLNTCLNNIYIENENENENENNKKGGLLRGEKETFVEPFAEKCSDFVDEKIFDDWQRWKKYKLEQFGFKYKSQSTEKTAYNRLMQLAGNNPKTAKEIINQSIANGWKGFFPLSGKSQPDNHEPGPKDFGTGVIIDKTKAKELLKKIKP